MNSGQPPLLNAGACQQRSTSVAISCVPLTVIAHGHSTFARDRAKTFHLKPQMKNFAKVFPFLDTTRLDCRVQ